VTVLTKQDVCMGLARVAERKFSFEIGSICTSQKLYKHFMHLCRKEKAHFSPAQTAEGNCQLHSQYLITL